MSTIIQTVKNKQLAQALRWTHKAVSRDNSRLVLRYVARIDGALVASDGYRLHAVQADTVLDEWPELWAPVSHTHYGTICIAPSIPAKAGVLEIADPGVLGDGDPQYPNLATVFPTEEPVFKIAVNPQYLREALDGMTGQVMLRFYGEFKPIEVLGIAGDSKAYALVMPMNMRDVPIDTWRPGKSPKESGS